MTVILVVLMMVVLLGADYLVQKIRAAGQRAAAPAFAIGAILADRSGLPDDVELALNHTWMRREPGGTVTIGLDEFIGGLLGAVGKILLPEPGSSLRQLNGGIVLREGARGLNVDIPVSGRVVAVNRDVLENPSLASADPYGRGWLLKVESGGGRRTALPTLSGGRAVEWLKEQAIAARELLTGNTSPALATMHDGGMPARGVLRQCDAGVWKAMQESFFTLRAEDELRER